MITAKFQADFSSFIDAVDHAQVKLADMGKGASQVEAKLNRMIDNFSGRKLIQEAALMTIAIEKTGGVSALTARELEQVGAKANEAADKLRRLGYEVPPGLQKLADATKEIGTSAKNTQGILAGLERQLLGMFTIGAVIAFGREVLAAGDHIQKMADQTSLGTEEVQKLQHIAGQSGTSIESLVGAVQNLQQRLGDDDSGAAGAMKKLGINLEAFSKLNTYQQMTSLGAAIKAIEDPTEQASVAAAIFGKTWKEILPAIKSGMQEVGDQAPIMSDATVKALDRAGDAMARAKQQAIVWGAGVVNAIEKVGFSFGDLLSVFDPAHLGTTNSRLLMLQEQLAGRDGLAGALQKIPPHTKAVGDGLKSVGLSAKEAEGLERGLTAAVNESISVNTKAAAAAAKLADAQQKFKDSVQGLSFKKFVADGLPMVGLMTDLSDRSGRFREHLFDLTSTFNEFHGGITVAGDEMQTVTIPMFSALPNVVPKATKAIRDATSATTELGVTLKDKLGGVLANIPNMLVSAFTGGGGLSGAIKGIGTMIGSALGEHIGKGLSALGKLGGPIGAAIGSLAGPLIALFGKLFDNPEKKINPVREAFVQLNGGLATLNARAQAAGISLNAMLNAKSPEQYQKAIEDLNAAFKFQDDAMELLTATAQKYGFTLAELGPALQKQNLGKQAEEIYQDFAVLTAGGLDHVAILTRMSEGVNTYIKNARAMGIEVPSSMEPMLQQMIDLGLLTDDNGDKITDLKGTGVTFSTTLTAGFKSVVDAVEKLAAAISGKLGTALAAIPSDVSIGVHFDVDTPEIPGPIPMARGGMGRVTKPTLFLAGESGPEDFAFSGGGKQFNDNSQTTGGMTFNVTIVNPSDADSLLEDLRKKVRQNYRGIRTDFAEAVTT